MILQTQQVEKCLTGVQGIDELTFGGLPRNRTTLLLGAPGSGKTILAAEFVAHGAADLGEPGVFVTLSQSSEHLARDLTSVGVDLAQLVSENKLQVVSIMPSDDNVVETGDYTLGGLFVMIERAIEKVGARRIVIDDFDALMECFHDASVLRREFRKLAERLTELEVTSILTGSIRRSWNRYHRMEEFLADCVVTMDHRIVNQIATRRLRVVKYRGTEHGGDEYPFVITSNGLLVYPVTSAGLNYPASTERISTGVADLDTMLDGKGFHKGSAVLVAGPAGSGKTTLGIQFAVSVAASGGKCAYFSFEESPDQLKRNLGSVGINMEPLMESGNLVIHSSRPSLQGLEQHLAVLHSVVETHGAEAVVIDPMTNLISVGSDVEVKAMLTRLLDGLKSRQITAVLTSLISEGDESFGAEIGISSLMDTILSIDSVVDGHRRKHQLSILKSRGTAHSQFVHELVFSSSGLHLVRPENHDESGGAQ